MFYTLKQLVRICLRKVLKYEFNYFSYYHSNYFPGCQASANPNNLTYKWYVNNEHIAGDISNELVRMRTQHMYFIN